MENVKPTHYCETIVIQSVCVELSELVPEHDDYDHQVTTSVAMETVN